MAINTFLFCISKILIAYIIFYIADRFKLDVLMELRPIEYIPLTILASVGQGKWEEKGGDKVTISPVLTGTVVGDSDCKTWRRAVSSWRVGSTVVVGVCGGNLALVVVSQLLWGRSL